MTQFATADGRTLSCYRADPTETPLGAVVLAHELSAITPHIRKVADDLAAQGYVAIAPSLFDRVEPGVELAERAAPLEQVDLGACLADLQAAVEAVKEIGKVAVVGYSWGADLAFLAANAVPDLACAIGYCGGAIIHGLAAKRRVPTLLHFSENDPASPLDDVQQFRMRRPDVSAFTYPAGPDFAQAGGSEFDAEATQKADERTLFWLSQYVVGQGPILLKNAGAYAAQKAEKKKSKKPAGDDDMGPPLD